MVKLISIDLEYAYIYDITAVGVLVLYIFNHAHCLIVSTHYQRPGLGPLQARHVIERPLSILSRLTDERTNEITRVVLQFRFSSAIHPLPLICLLGNSQVGQLRGHDAARARAGNDAVFGKVGDAGVLAEEIFVEDQLAVDFCGGGAQDGEDGVGEDCGLAEVFFLAGVFLCELLGGGGFDGLDDGLC